MAVPAVCAVSARSGGGNGLVFLDPEQHDDDEHGAHKHEVHTHDSTHITNFCLTLESSTFLEQVLEAMPVHKEQRGWPVKEQEHEAKPVHKEQHGWPKLLPSTVTCARGLGALPAPALGDNIAFASSPSVGARGCATDGSLETCPPCSRLTRSKPVPTPTSSR